MYVKFDPVNVRRKENTGTANVGSPSSSSTDTSGPKRLLVVKINTLLKQHMGDMCLSQSSGVDCRFY